MSKFQTSLANISVTIELWIYVFWVISVQYDLRNTLPKSGPFLLLHSVYSKVLRVTFVSSLSVTKGVFNLHFMERLYSKQKLVLLMKNLFCNAITILHDRYGYNWLGLFQQALGATTLHGIQNSLDTFHKKECLQNKLAI